MMRSLSFVLAAAMVHIVAPVLSAATPSGADHAATAHEQPGLLSPDIGSAFWTIVLFCLLLFVLGKFVWPPILKGLQDREGKIRADLEQAENAARQATRTLEEYQRQLADAQAQARQLIEEARAQAQRAGEELKVQTQQDIAAMRKRAEHDIRVAGQEAITQLYSQTAVVATEIASRILRREIRPEDQQQLIRSALDEIEKSKRN